MLWIDGQAAEMMSTEDLRAAAYRLEGELKTEKDATKRSYAEMSLRAVRAELSLRARG